MRSVGVYDAERSIAVFDLSQLEPLATVDVWSTTRTASGRQAASLRLASFFAEARVVVTLLCRRLGGAGRAFHERPAVGSLGHLLVVIGSEAEIEATDQFLLAAARCAAAGGAAVEMVPVSHPDTEVRLYSADGIALRPTNMATLPGGSVPMNVLDWAARQVQAQSRAIAMPVGSSLVVIGSREEVAAAEEEIGRLRGAGTTGL